MTHARLVQELGTGELAYQVAFDELEAARASSQAARAQRLTEQLRTHGGR